MKQWMVVGSLSTLLTGCVTEMGPAHGTLTAHRDLKFRTVFSSPIEMQAGESQPAVFKVDGAIREIQMELKDKKVVFGWAKGEGDSVYSSPKDSNQNLNDLKLGARATRKFLDSDTSTYEGTESCTYKVARQVWVCRDRDRGRDRDRHEDRGDRYDRDRNRGRDRDHGRERDCRWETVYDSYPGHQRVRVTTVTTEYAFNVDIIDSDKAVVADASGEYSDVSRSSHPLEACR